MGDIVVGVDESECAARALRWAAREAQLRGARVTAVLAWGLLDQHAASGGTPFDPAYGERDALEALDAAVVAAIGAEAAADVDRRAICDLAASALVEAADDADLLVVGRRGLGGFKGLLLGSVSERCVRQGQVPVAVIGTEPNRPVPGELERIVVGVDGSATSQLAFRWALDEARLRGAAVEAVHVWHAPYVEGYGHTITGVDPLSFQEAGRQLLDRVVSAEDTSGLPVPVERVLVDDGPAGSILEAAKGADLVVVGSRGLGGVKRWLLGSVSQQVVHHAPCPVVVVPAAAE